MGFVRLFVLFCFGLVLAYILSTKPWEIEKRGNIFVYIERGGEE